MNLQSLFIFQLLADLLLCIALVFVLFLITRESKKRNAQTVDPAIVMEFKRILDASQQATTTLLRTMDDSRKALKEIAYSLDDRENRLRTLMAQVDERLVKKTTIPTDVPAGTDDRLENRYADVLLLARQGVDTDEIARICGLPRGEIDLIIDLDRQKSVSS
jgi:hypothetical protein